MRNMMQVLMVSAVGIAVGIAPLAAQTGAGAERSAAAFASENAILDTAIPFAIGAREARQALRGAFGWPSFQEGLVEGVYFRFDPDGYARFAPTPRLDVDVFEVICRPRTYSCAARKDGLEVFLTDRGQLQMKLENVLAGDSFFVAEGVSEIQVPERVIQPLDVPLELILGSGGEMITRRGGTEVARVSLKGFSAVTAYLRWIAARQDYAVLPRGWPVPNAERAGHAGGMTQPTAWNSPMPQPQVIAPGYATNVAAGIAPATTSAPLTLPQGNPSAMTVQVQPVISPFGNYGGTEDGQVDDLRTELEALRDLMERTQGGSPTSDVVMAPHMAPLYAAPRPDAQTDLSHVLRKIEALQEQVARLQPEDLPNGSDDQADAMTAQNSGAQMLEPIAAGAETQPLDDNQKLAVLVKDLGLDAQTALTVLRLLQEGGAPGALSVAESNVSSEMAEDVRTQPIEALYEQTLVDQILTDMEAELNAISSGTVAEPQPPVIVREPEFEADYQLLSRYFASAVLPALQHRQNGTSDPTVTDE